MSITQLQQQAQQKFSELELPTTNHGKGFALSSNVDWEKVFTDIKAEEAQIAADERVKVCKLSELGEEFVAKYAQRLVPAGENKLLALHYTINPDAQVIIIPKNAIAEEPIIINSETETMAAESIIVVAEEGAQATIVEKTNSTAHYKSQIVQLYVKPRAKISYCTIHDEAEGTHVFSTKRAEVLQDASVKWFDFAVGKGFAQIQLRSHLRETGAEAQQYQAIVGTETQQCDITADAFHEQSNTASTMLTKGILSNKSRAMHYGKIRVEKNATNCSGHQRSDILLIGDESRCNAIPVLEVENDDVSCSHGATMGQIDEEQLYYLVSRGLDENIAKQMLVTTFLEPIVQKISDEKVREEVTDKIQYRLERK